MNCVGDAIFRGSIVNNQQSNVAVQVNLYQDSLAEEIANSITHGIGAALSIAALTSLVILAAMNGDSVDVIGVTIYGATLVFLYMASTLYHGIQFKPLKEFFLVLDHVGIALLIAGTYTPILLLRIRTTEGLIFLGTIWGLALITAIVKSFFTSRYTILSTLAYLTMGCLSLFLIDSMTNSMGIDGFWWIKAGGLSYILGIIPFSLRRIPFNHAIWHIFVIGGSVCHFIAILFYVLPSV